MYEILRVYDSKVLQLKGTHFWWLFFNFKMCICMYKPSNPILTREPQHIAFGSKKLIFEDIYIWWMKH